VLPFDEFLTALGKIGDDVEEEDDGVRTDRCLLFWTNSCSRPFLLCSEDDEIFVNGGADASVAYLDLVIFVLFCLDNGCSGFLCIGCVGVVLLDPEPIFRLNLDRRIDYRNFKQMWLFWINSWRFYRRFVRR